MALRSPPACGRRSHAPIVERGVRATRRRPLAHYSRSLHTCGICNLYSLTKGQSAIRDLFRATKDRAGNLPLLPAIFPDQLASIVRVGPDGERELVMARWGMPGPAHSARRRVAARWLRGCLPAARRRIRRRARFCR